ncbi:MAG TPA: PAS domain-containing protein, partial [Casimicrobiaceae bacterium]
MGERMRRLDWTSTSLGPPDAWPQSLKTIVRVMLDSRYAMWMLWGQQMTFFCNDAYLPTVGIKRDWVLGARADKVWEEIWTDIGPRIQHVLENGEATWDEALLLFLERSGFSEETYHTFSYSPVYDDDSRIAGMLCVVTEVTERVIGERRLRVLRDLAARAVGVETVEDSCRGACEVLALYPADVPFAALYLADGDQRRVHLVAATKKSVEDVL